MNKTSKGFISIIIPTKDRLELLLRLLRGIENQNYKQYEVIIVDDSNSLKTKNNKNRFPITRNKVKYFKNKMNKGANYSRNKGLKEASGEFVTFLDDDDEVTANHLKNLINNFNRKYSLVCPWTKVIANNATYIVRKHKFINLNMISYENYVGNTFLTLTSRLLKINGFDENLEASQDYDVNFRLIKKYGDAISVPKVSHIVHQEHEYDRISDKKWTKKYKFYIKHKTKFNSKQRRYQLYKILNKYNKKRAMKVAPIIKLIIIKIINFYYVKKDG